VRATAYTLAAGWNSRKNIGILFNAMQKETDAQVHGAAQNALRIMSLPPAQQEQLINLRRSRMKKAAVYLTKKQNRDGSWGITNAAGIGPDSEPKHMGATGATSWAVQALNQYLTDNLAKKLSPQLRGKIIKAVNRGNQFVMQHSVLPLQPYHSGERALSLGHNLIHLSRMTPSRKRDAAIRRLIREMDKIQLKDSGGFGYSGYGENDASPYLTATAVLGLAAANTALHGSNGTTQKNGIARMMRLGAQMLIKNRSKDGFYSHASRDRKTGSGPISSMNRSLAADYALMQSGYFNADDLNGALENFMIYKGTLENFVHEARMQTTPGQAPTYLSDDFYLFGIRYAAQILNAVETTEKLTYARELTADLLRQQYPDGSFMDASGTGHAYATAAALSALVNTNALLLQEEELLTSLQQ